MNVSATGVAIDTLTDAAKVAPGEPMVWAARSVAYLQENDPAKNDLKRAADDLDNAKALKPDNSLIVMLTAALEQQRGNTPQALTLLRRAVTLDPKNVQALYKLDKMLEAQQNSGPERTDIHKKLLEAQPDNIAFLLFVMQDAADAGDRTQLHTLIDRVKQRLDIVPSNARGYLKTLEQALAANSAQPITMPMTQFRYLMVNTPAYREALAYLPADKSHSPSAGDATGHAGSFPRSLCTGRIAGIRGAASAGDRAGQVESGAHLHPGAGSLREDRHIGL